MSDAPTVTVLIPARNEEADIERCLRAVLAQDHPHDRMEIVLVDGGSSDRTVQLATRALEDGDIDWKIVDNPVGTTPSNLNAGLAVASGEVLCRVDARSIVPAKYVRICAEGLTQRPEVAVTGGAQVALSRNGSVLSAGIARALNNKYAMGGARYRSGAPSGPSDTVYLGAFRTDELRAIGGWDEFFETNQDYELNRRMGRRGLVWFDDRLQVGYIPRKNLLALSKQYHRFGRWKVRYWRHAAEGPQPRQFVALGAGLLTCVAGVAVVLSSRRRVSNVAAVAVTGGLALAAVDGIGSDSAAPAPVRAVSVAAIGGATGGWISGVVRQAMVR